MQPVQLTILHFGTPAKAEISIAGKINKRYDVQNGFNVFELPVKAVKVKTALKIHAAIGNLLSEDISILQNPIVFREIDLIHNAHTDIGYSHIQEEVINIHNQNIRNAIDLIEKTKDYPEGSKFTWHVESSWVAENFMKVATEKEKQLFIKDVKKGQIVISGTFANVLTGLSTPEEMNWITEYSCKLRDSFGFPIKTAMMSDIPGMSWSMVQALAQHGIRYFSNGPNYVENFPDKGDRIGHTLNDLGDKPFWWKSPSGKDSILFWTCGKGYSSWHGFSQGLVMERGPDKIAGYINELDAKGYPYEMLQWRYNIVADNGTTDSSISTFVQQWNEKYSSPKLVLANATELFERFEQRYGKTIPVYSGDFTPYWEDGAYSTAYEEAETRMLSERIEQLENIAKQNSQVLNADWLYQAKRNIVLFHEHTWGAWCSITKPDDPFTIHQWNYKKSFMDSAKYFTDLIETALFSETSNPSSITVFNDLSWSRTGYAEVPNPANVKANSLADESGNIIPLQKNSDGKLSFIAKDIPANGQKTYRLTENNIKPDFVTNFNCAVDSVTGSIKALTSKERQWVNNNEYKGILQALYVNGLNPSSFVLSSFKKMEWVDNGPAVKRMRITCSMDGTNELVYEISLFNGLDMVQFSAIIDKKAIREKESLHIAFPFAIDNAKVRIGVGDGIISPNDKQIPGSNKDFFSVQRWIDVSGNNDGITLSCPQGALFEVGEMVNEERTLDGYKKWKDSASSSSTIFLYAMNNYWHTNYKADQPGKVRFDFYLHPHKNFEAANATRFGYESTQPLKAWLH